MCKNGGTCVDKEMGTMVCNCSEGFTGDTCEERACQHDDCLLELARNGLCDMKCFTRECGFDGGEAYCLPNDTADPWKACPQASFCRRSSENGECDPDCNTRECLFDSYECVPHLECPAEQTEQCLNGADDGTCDEDCNTPQCPFDSKDCDSREFLKDKLVVYILGPAGQSFSQDEEAQRQFAEAVGAITNTNPVIDSIELLSAKEGLQQKIVVPEGQNLYRVTLRLDKEYCSDQCIKSVEEAVNFLNAYYASGQDIAGFSYVKSGPETDEPPTSGPSGPNTALAVTVTIIVVALLGLFVVGGVLVRKRKTIKLVSTTLYSHHLSPRK
jgi:Notch-like protein